MTFISSSYLGQKHVITENTLKIFSRNINARGEQKAVSKSRKSAKILKITISMLNMFFTYSFRAKTVLPGYRKSYPRNPEMDSYLTFDLPVYFKVKPRS
jgi:hypothetical protein